MQNKNDTAKSADTSKKKSDASKAKSKSAALKSEKKPPKKNTKKPSAKTKAAEVPKAPKKKGLNIKYLGGLLFAKMAKGGTSALRSNAEAVNQLNVFPVPDGDTGDNMRMTIESGIAAIENLDTDDLAHVMKLFSHGMLLGARGNSGVILSQLFAGMAKGLESESAADPAAIATALQMGVEQAYTSVMTPTEGTILTVAREATEYAVSRLTEKSTVRSLFADLLSEMRASLDRTPELLTVLKEAGVVDSGGAGLFYIMDGFNRVLNGEEVAESAPVAPLAAPIAPDPSAFGPDSEMIWGYCTEFLLQLQRAKCDIDAFDLDALKAFLTKNGDSVVVFQTDSIVKVHVHTKTPERILARARRFGEFISVKIENMSLQHSELADMGAAQEKSTPRERKKYGVVCVSSGAGLSALFREFGADEIVDGGQTNNPSTGDFLAAYERINAEHIFVFPNNGNIILAAEQSAEIYKDAKVHVVPAKSVGAGYVALSSADLTLDDPDAILASMREAIDRILTGYISPAIRDADMNGVHVTSGDTIGVIGKEIALSRAERVDALTGLADALLSGGDRFLLTVITGEDASDADAAALADHIKAAYPMVELYFIEGTQKIHPYILIAE